MNLQTALIAIGIFVVVVVYAVSKIRERKNALKRSASGSRGSSESPIRSGKGRLSEDEPSLMEGAPPRLEDEVPLINPFDITSGRIDDQDLNPDEIETLQDIVSADEVPVSPPDRKTVVASKVENDLTRDFPSDGLIQDEQGESQYPEVSREGPEWELEDVTEDTQKSLFDVASDDDSEIIDWEDLPGVDNSEYYSNPPDDPSQDPPQAKSSSEYRYPRIQGFERISQIDYWIKLTGRRDVGRESVLAQYREASSLISKPNQIFGLKIPEKTWCALEQESEDARFGDLVITLQLADQNGTISQEDMRQFLGLARQLAEGIGYDFSTMAPVESALQQSKAINDYIRYYDSVFVIHVKPLQSAYFEGAVIHRCATQLGLDQSSKGFFVRNKPFKKDTVSLYYLADMSETGEFDFRNMEHMQMRGVTFFTKPALNRSPGAVFAEMADTANAFAARIKGKAIAPNHHGLPQEYVENVRQSMEKVAQEMEGQGIASGSEEAMRLF